MPHIHMEKKPPKFKILGIWFTNDLKKKECEVVDFCEKFLEIKSLYKVWLNKSFYTKYG